MLFLLLLALTGIVLNHADDLGLSAAYPPAALQQALYGSEAPTVDAVYAAADILFASAAGTLYADGERMADIKGTLRGAVLVDDGILLATGEEILLATGRAELVERFSLELEYAVDRIGRNTQGVVLSAGPQFLVLDPEQMRLSGDVEPAPGGIDWSQPAEPGTAVTTQIESAELGRLFSWERVLLDVHSGRVLPVAGRLLADLAALCLIYLCVTGLLLWFRRR